MREVCELWRIVIDILERLHDPVERVDCLGSQSGLVLEKVKVLLGLLGHFHTDQSAFSVSVRNRCRSISAAARAQEDIWALRVRIRVIKNKHCVGLSSHLFVAVICIASGRRERERRRERRRVLDD